MSRQHTDESRAKISQKARDRYKWDDAKVERVKTLVLAGASSREVQRQERVYRGTLKQFCLEHGLSYVERRSATQAGDDLLKAKYATAPDLNALLAEYREARGYRASHAAMRQNASRLGVSRPRLCADAKVTRPDQLARYNEYRRAVAPILQEHLNAGIGVCQAAKLAGIGKKRAFRMVQDGLVSRPPPPPKLPKLPRIVTAKPELEPKPPKPKKLPKSWVRTVEAPKPRPVYETVEAFLAAGGRVTQCPAAAVYVTTATLGEGRDVIRRHASFMAGDDGNWIQRSKKKMGRFHFGGQSA